MNIQLGKRVQSVRTVSFDSPKNQVRLIEQRLLPHQFKIVATKSFEETAQAIADMVVRGAGAIGATAAYGLAQGARAFRGSQLSVFQKHVGRVYDTLKKARPTAVDPVNAMDTVRSAMESGDSVAAQQKIALDCAEQFAEEDVAHCRAIGEHGAPLIRDGMRIMTHCNAGWLAFVDIGSATAPLYAAQAQGKRFHVLCSETRPRSQGATLTAWELSHQGISHQIIADNAAGHLMQRGQVDLVIVGSDRTLGRTGEVANMKAVLAARHRIPFYVAIPLSTLDWELPNGEGIPIEERSPEEVLSAYGVTEEGDFERVRIGNPTSSALNPGFDVTPPELITGIITPEGIYKPSELWRNRRKLGFQG
jgi:methylthioribose-1-phosphate isomerase